MIHREGQVLFMCCDTCADYEESDQHKPFNDFIADCRKLGWAIEKPRHGEWTHTCPSCVMKNAGLEA